MVTTSAVEVLNHVIAESGKTLVHQVDVISNRYGIREFLVSLQ